MEHPLELRYTATAEKTTKEGLAVLIPEVVLAIPGRVWLSGTLNGRPFQAEAASVGPGHVLSLDPALCQSFGIKEGDLLKLDFQVSRTAPQAVVATELTSVNQDNYMALLNQMTTTEEVPAEVKGWSWAAFLLGPVWGPVYGVWSGLVFIIPYLYIFGSTFTTISVIGGIVLIPLYTRFGRKGNEWAWRSRTWDSVEQFKSVQRRWAVWSFLLIAVITVVTSIITLRSFSSETNLNSSQLNQGTVQDLQGL